MLTLPWSAFWLLVSVRDVKRDLYEFPICLNFTGPLLCLFFLYYTVSLLLTVFFSGWISSGGNSCATSWCLWFHGVFCDSWLFDLWDLFVLFLQVLIWCQKTLCFQRLTVLMFNSQKYWFAIGRRVCLPQLAVLLKNNSICFMPNSPCVPFQNTFVLTAAKPTTLKME